MIRKAIVIVGSLFLAILFLSTIGSFYTGYAVLNQEDLTLQHYPYPFVKNNVPNDVYIVIPYDYSYSEFKVAQDIAESIKGKNLVSPSIVTDINVPQGEHNLILIGNPCNNDLIQELLATFECNSGLEEGQALISLINNYRTSTLIISSYTSEDLEKSSVILSNYNFYPLMKKKIIVSGGIGNLVLNYY